MEQLSVEGLGIATYKVFMWRKGQWVEVFTVKAHKETAAWLAVHARLPGAEFSSLRGAEATMYEYNRQNQKKYFRMRVVKQKNPR